VYGKIIFSNEKGGGGEEFKVQQDSDLGEEGIHAERRSLRESAGRQTREFNVWMGGPGYLGKAKSRKGKTAHLLLRKKERWSSKCDKRFGSRTDPTEGW